MVHSLTMIPTSQQRSRGTGRDSGRLLLAGATLITALSACAAGTAGGAGGQGGVAMSSSGSGACATPADCPKSDCLVATCNNGLCETTPVAAGTATPMQTKGDCNSKACDGAGSTMVVTDDSDLPDDNNPCTNDVCAGGVASHANLASGVSCGAGMTCDGQGNCAGPKRIFVTAATFQGNLLMVGGGATGLSGADNLCGVAANQGSLGGTWKAWLSDGATNAIDRITDVGPWLLVGTGAKVFASKANLMTAPLVPINRDEHGVQIASGNGVYAWTATATGGTFSQLDCYDWTSIGGGDFGNVGNPNGTGDWTQFNGTSCDGAYHLYCLEQ